MARSHLSTTQIARAIGVHPNTVRVYEMWGFLPPVPRSPSGYRLYTQRHLDQMRLARTTLHGGWPGKAIRESALAPHPSSSALGCGVMPARRVDACQRRARHLLW